MSGLDGLRPDHNFYTRYSHLYALPVSRTNMFFTFSSQITFAKVSNFLSYYLISFCISFLSVFIFTCSFKLFHIYFNCLVAATCSELNYLLKAAAPASQKEGNSLYLIAAIQTTAAI